MSPVKDLSSAVATVSSFVSCCSEAMPAEFDSKGDMSADARIIGIDQGAKLSIMSKLRPLRSHIEHAVTAAAHASSTKAKAVESAEKLIDGIKSKLMDLKSKDYGGAASKGKAASEAVCARKSQQPARATADAMCHALPAMDLSAGGEGFPMQPMLGQHGKHAPPAKKGPKHEQCNCKYCKAPHIPRQHRKCYDRIKDAKKAAKKEKGKSKKDPKIDSEDTSEYSKS